MVILTDLQPETNYQITVSAYTIKGDGASSVPTFAKTSAKLPDPPHVFKSPSSPSEVIIRWRTSARDVVSYKLKYGKSLQRLRARDQAKLKMKEMTFLPRTNTHKFRGLGELSIVFFDLNIFLSFAFVLIPHETALSFLFLRSLAPLLIDDFTLSFIRSICLSFHSFIRLFVRSGLNSFVGSFLISFIRSFLRSLFLFLRSLVRSYVRSFFRTYVHSFLHSYFLSFIRQSAYAFFRLCVRSAVRSFVRWFVHTCVHSFLHSFSLFFIRPFAVWFVRSFVRSCVSLFVCFVLPSFLLAFFPSLICSLVLLSFLDTTFTITFSN